MKIKICSKCGIDKSTNRFSKDKNTKNGLRSWCKDCCKVYRKIYNKLHKSKIYARQKKYNLAHKEEIAVYDNKYRKQRKKIDSNFKLIYNIRIRILQALKRNSKHTSTVKLLGCTIKELKVHLQKHFTPGMTWKNHSLKGWHIDHIRPCASFDLSQPKEQRKCFHYSNLQPLWAIDNIKKGYKYNSQNKEK